MKKIFALAISLVMACSLMTACSEKDTDDDKDPSSSSVQEKDSSENDSSSEQTDDSSKEEDASSDDDTSSEDDSSSTDDDSSEAPSVSGDASAPMGETVGDAITDIDTAPFEALSAIGGSDTFTLDVTISGEMEGTKIEMPLVIVRDGDDSYVKMNMFGLIDMEILTLDGKTYMIDSASKQYYVDASGESGSEVDSYTDEVEEIAGFDADMVKSSNKVTIDGDEYIRYEVEEDGETMYVYAKGGNIKYIAGNDPDSGTMVFTFNEISNTANTDYLKVPEGYTEVTEEEYQASVMGGLGFGDE